MAGGESQMQYTMQLHSRVLVPFGGQGRGASQWLVGSTSLRDENEVGAGLPGLPRLHAASACMP
jgi:hypothetical protein